ncbi:glycoside hydrolase family 3 protein [Amanita thiersii Skay4041]|uniref:beta-glucosidase n=1 Tax=Amanita thiersii Skay4041 TaxID=703135 RepID=A0A2A9NMJ1_9AGAR|nr:glycoside hydrolase family 3 protein [Amanita thiersii Skay4041]
MVVDFEIGEVLAKLTIPQKIKLLTGLGWWHTEPIPEHGIESIRLSDGPNGVRGTRVFNGVPASCFPCSTGLGSSFDVELAYNIGQALGDEARAKSVHVLLAPTVNIQRSPLGGRDFESFAEDPHLNGTIASAYINGVQSKGVIATIKHFVANDQEFQSERALREIYLKPFQIALKHSNPGALMSSYNRVNGVHASESKWLLDDILRKEWGFQGLIMSDWIGVYSTSESIKAGLDLEMPGPSVMRGKALQRALIGEKVLLGDIDTRARKVLELLKRAYSSGIPCNGPEVSIDTPQICQLLRTAAADAIVLLKNDKHLLPLTRDSTLAIKRIAIIGTNAKHAMTSGGGSAQLLSTYTITPLDAITAAAKEIGAEIKFSIGTASYKYLPLLDPYIKQQNGQSGAVVEFWNESPSDDFTSPNSNLNQNLMPCTWNVVTQGSVCKLKDGIDEKVNLKCWIRYSTQFTPDEDGDWTFDLSLAGRGNLFIDGKLELDLTTDPNQGEFSFGLGTDDVSSLVKGITIVKGLKAGQTYGLEVRLSNAQFVDGSLPFPSRGGLRLGALRHFESHQGIIDAVQAAKESDVAILVVGLNNDYETEGFDRPTLDLPGTTNELVEKVLQANPNTIVVNQSGAPVTMPWIKEANTVVQAFYGGNELGNGLADVLFGKVNPSSKLPLTFPKRLEDTPPFPSFGSNGQEHGKILYNEGVFVGYRNYEIRNLEPLFPFGHGLSYTRFEYSNLEISDVTPEGNFTVKFSIKNIGTVDGREVVQIYVTDEMASLPRPAKELKGYKKVALKSGESKVVLVPLDREAFGFFDDRNMHWIAEKGDFFILVAASSADVKLKGMVHLEKTFTWTGL